MTKMPTTPVDLIATFHARIAEFALEAKALQSEQPQYVIEIQGLYINLDDRRQPRACGINGASRFTFAAATKVAPRITNGNGQTGKIVDLREALQTETQHTLELISMWEKTPV